MTRFLTSTCSTTRRLPPCQIQTLGCCDESREWSIDVQRWLLPVRHMAVFFCIWVESRPCSFFGQQPFLHLLRQPASSSKASSGSNNAPSSPSTLRSHSDGCQNSRVRCLDESSKQPTVAGWAGDAVRNAPLANGRPINNNAPVQLCPVRTPVLRYLRYRLFPLSLLGTCSSLLQFISQDWRMTFPIANFLTGHSSHGISA